MTHLSDELLNEILDGEADPAARGAADAHMADCPSCTARLKDLRALFGMLANLPAQVAERDFTPTVIAQLVPHTRTERLPRAISWVAFGQVVAAVLVGYLLWPVADVLEGFSLAAFFTTHSASLLESFQDMSLTWPSLEIPAPGLPLSTATLILAVAGALLVWLLGNGLLLIPGSRRRLWTKS